MKKYFVLLFCLLLLLKPMAQNVKVVNDTSFLKSAWVGGLNACQFGRIDLNGDGIKDLVVFDRQGEKILCFVNQGAENEIDYRYDAQYENLFPQIHAWFQLCDYNNDGKEDIFTYSKGWAGIKVYKNVGEHTPAFQLEKYPYITSYQSGGFVNILATDADYPAIVDLDGDGDLDILTFSILGTFIEKHTNLSVETFGNADSLLFERTDRCWGRVVENEENNVMYLDTCVFGREITLPFDDFRHRGATFAIRDLNGDSNPDLLLADVGYPGITMLLSGNVNNSLSMISQDTLFPSNQIPVKLFSMPLPFFTDINNDGVDDLLVSPFDPEEQSCQGQNSVWLYLNEGSKSQPNFVLHSTSFLQDAMIDVGMASSPTFFDVDDDGLIDMIVGNKGEIVDSHYEYGNLVVKRVASLSWFKNIGTFAQPLFKIFDADFGALSLLGQQNLTPVFADVDADGNSELVVGTAAGKLLLLKNINQTWQLVDEDFLTISNKKFIVPCFFDMNADGFADLILGQQNGKLSYYEAQLVENQLIYTLKTDFFGGVDVRDYNSSYYGFSQPFVMKKTNENILFVGSESGKLFIYNNLSDSLFTEISAQASDYISDTAALNRAGWNLSVYAADINADNLPEFVLGNMSGGLQLFNAQVAVAYSVDDYDREKMIVSPNPADAVVIVKVNYVSDWQIEIYNLQGQKLLSKTCHESSAELNVSEFTRGVYLLKTNNETSIHVSKLVVK